MSNLLRAVPSTPPPGGAASGAAAADAAELASRGLRGLTALTSKVSERMGVVVVSADAVRCPPGLKLNIPPWLFCMSWCPDFEFRRAQALGKASVNLSTVMGMSPGLDQPQSRALS